MSYAWNLTSIVNYFDGPNTFDILHHKVLLNRTCNNASLVVGEQLTISLSSVHGCKSVGREGTETFASAAGHLSRSNSFS